jgi:glycosyltransferase involved in cell wall biosynthesis
MPAYNEEKRIARTLEDYCRFFSELKKSKELDFEILVVINNTTDRTEEIVKIFQRKCKELKYLNFKQGGKGFAVRKGFEYALQKDFDLIGFVDADDSTNANEYFRLIRRIGSYDGVVGSRYMKGAIVIPKPTIQRLICKMMFNTLIRTLLLMPYRDTQCGAKIFKRNALEKALPCLSMSQWAFDIDLLYSLRKLGFAIREVPIIWSDREYSRINFFGAGPWMVLALIRLRLYNSPFKGVVDAYSRITNFIYGFGR